MKTLISVVISLSLCIASLSASAGIKVASNNYVAPGCTKTTLHNGYGLLVVGIRCGTTSGPFVAVIQTGYNSVQFYSVAPGYTTSSYGGGSTSWSLFRN